MLRSGGRKGYESGVLDAVVSSEVAGSFLPDCSVLR